MTQRFSLATYDAFIDDKIIEDAEKLLTDGANVSIKSLENNIRVGYFTEDNTTVETELLLKGTKVSDYLCECNRTSDGRICRHVTAIILFILKEKKVQTEKREAEKLQKTVREANAPPVRVTINQILQRTDPTQLIDFIAAYSRNDKHFALALKTRFLQDFYGHEDILNATSRLMEDTLRAVKTQRGTITPLGWSQIFTILDELKQKTENGLTRGDIRNWFSTWSFSLKYVLRFLRMTESPFNKLEKRKLQLLENLKTIGAQDFPPLSPELKEEIGNCLLELCDTYGKFPFCLPLFDATIRISDVGLRMPAAQQKTEMRHPQTEINTHLLEIVNKILASPSLSYEVNDRLTRTKIQLLQKSGQWEEARYAVITSSKNPDVIIEIIEETINTGDYNTAENLIEEVDKIYFDVKRVTDKLNELSLKIAVATNNTKDILAYGESIFTRNLDLDTFKLLQQNGLTPQKFERIIQTIEKRPYSIEKRDVISALLFEEKQYDRLLSFITELQSLELVKRYGVELWQDSCQISESEIRNSKSQIIEMFGSVFSNYLQTHLGKPPLTRLRVIFEYFLEKNAIELVKQLTADVVKNFPERGILREEFSVMFEEFKKRELLLNFE